jgi:hypothetical protein
MEDYIASNLVSLLAWSDTKRLQFSNRQSIDQLTNYIFEKRDPIAYDGFARDGILNKTFPSYLDLSKVLKLLSRKKEKANNKKKKTLLTKSQLLKQLSQTNQHEIIYRRDILHMSNKNVADTLGLKHTKVNNILRSYRERGNDITKIVRGR